MIAERYFALRAQLGTALFSLQSLAAELHAPEATNSELGELQQSLREPFLIVVLGDAQAGKSSFLNALAGREFEELRSAPGFALVQSLKYAADSRDVPVRGEGIEFHRSAIFLRDFTLVEVPAVRALPEASGTLTREFLHAADLVIFVWNARSAWAPSGWAMLEALDRALLEKTIFVLQQADQRTPADVAAVVGELEQTLFQRRGVRRPVLAVSAQAALAAKLAPNQLVDTGFDHLEDSIDAHLMGAASRVRGVNDVAKAAQKILQGLRARVAEGAGVVEQDETRRRQLSETLAERKEQSLRQIGGILWTLTQAYETAHRQGEDLLRRKLTWRGLLSSLTRTPVWHAGSLNEIEGRLRETVERHVESSLDALENDQRNVSQQFQESLQKSFPSGARVTAALPDFTKQRCALATAIQTTLCGGDLAEAGGGQLDRMFARTAISLRLTAALAAAGGVFALAGAAMKAPGTYVAAAVAACAGLLGIIIGILRRVKMLRAFRRQLHEAREKVINAIEDHLRPAVNAFYKELDSAFIPLRSFGAGQRKLYTSVFDRLAQLEATCRRCEADSASLSGVAREAAPSSGSDADEEKPGATG